MHISKWMAIVSRPGPTSSRLIQSLAQDNWQYFGEDGITAEETLKVQGRLHPLDPSFGYFKGGHMNLQSAIELHMTRRIRAGGPGSGRHKEFDTRLQSLGYKHQGYFGEKKAGVPAHHYYNEKSGRAVSVTPAGDWETKRGTWGTKESGNGPQSFFQKYHSGGKVQADTFYGPNEGGMGPSELGDPE